MKRKSVFTIGLACLLGAAVFTSCKDEDPVDISLINFDRFEHGPIDQWIDENLTEPYNIEVVYRYRRDMHDQDRNIAPADEAKVIPQMEIMIEGFLNVFEKVGGTTFIKRYSPKQFALFGSGNYRPDGVVLAGTADAGRRITLYGVNNLDLANPNSVLGNLGVVHHEFVHILNQIRTIPPDFELVSVGDYYTNWTDNNQNPESTSRSLGFITRYARSSVGEDFAETMSILIVRGQAYYDAYAYASGQVGWSRLKQKESIVRDYLMSNFNMDLSDLQYEFAQVMTNKYNNGAYYGVPALIQQNQMGVISLDVAKAWAVEHGVSPTYKAAFDDLVNRFRNNNGYEVDNINLAFASPSKATLQVNFSRVNVGSYWSYYDLDLTVPAPGRYAFSLSATQGTSVPHDNGTIAWVRWNSQPMLDYLSSVVFVAKWFPFDAITTKETFQKFLGFHEDGDEGNYFYGPRTANTY